MYQETCKLYDRVMRLLERRKQKTDVASVVSIDNIFVRSITVILVMETQAEELSSSTGVVETKFFIC